MYSEMRKCPLDTFICICVLYDLSVLCIMTYKPSKLFRAICRFEQFRDRENECQFRNCVRLLRNLEIVQERLALDLRVLTAPRAYTCATVRM